MAIYRTGTGSFTRPLGTSDYKIEVSYNIYTDDTTNLSTVNYTTNFYGIAGNTIKFDTNPTMIITYHDYNTVSSGYQIVPLTSGTKGQEIVFPSAGIEYVGEMTNVDFHTSSGVLYANQLTSNLRTATITLLFTDLTTGKEYRIQNTDSLSMHDVPKPTGVICSPAYLGDEATITVSPGRAYYTHTITYVFGEMSGTIAAETSNTTIKWTLPENFLTQFADDETAKTGTLYCQIDGIYDTVITTYPFTALLDGDAVGPQFFPVVTDTNATTVALTGDNTKLIKYFSNAYVETNVVAQSGSAISSVSITWGNKKIYEDKGTFNNVDVDRFTMEAMDNRGFVAIMPVIYSASEFIPYTKLSCNAFPQVVLTDGSLSMSIEGNFFNDSFGAVSNSLTVQYRYKLKNGTYSSWIAASATINPGGYKCEVSITGLDYRAQYIIQARAIDKIMTVTTPEITVSSRPIFDLGPEDFNFNVPVYNQEYEVFAEGKGIYGQDSYGSEKIALMPQDSIGNTVLGFGNYQSGDGDTMIYGENVHIFSNNDVTVNGVSLLGDTGGVTLQNIVNALGTGYSYTPTIVANGSNFATVSCSLTLRGNCLYCRLYGSRSALSGTGDFTDELVGQFIFDHGGKITAMDYVSGVTGQSGPTASFAIKNVVTSGETTQFDVYLTNSAAAARNFMAAFTVPVSIDLTKF